MNTVPGTGDVGATEPTEPSHSEAAELAAGETGGPLTTSLAWATWALFVGLGLMLSGAVIMGLIGNDGFAWTVVVVHATIGVYLVFRMVQIRAPLRAKPWNEVALAGRVFYLPATAVGTGRRIRESSTRRVPLVGKEPVMSPPPPLPTGDSGSDRHVTS